MIRPTLSLLACVSLLSAADNPPPAAARTPPPPPPEQVLRAPEPGRFKTLFQPFRTESSALSPDGKHLAYSLREGEALCVVVVEIDHPETMKAKVVVANDTGATGMMAANQAENSPAHIRWMRWTTANRLALETNSVSHVGFQDDNWTSLTGQIIAFDADGANARILLRPGDLTEQIPPADFFKWFDSRSATYDMSRPVNDVPAENNLSGGRAFATNQPLSGVPDEAPAAPAQGVISQAAPGTAVDPATLPPGTGGAKLSPQIFHVFDLDPAKPGCVTLVAIGTPRNDNTRRLSFQRLDTVTGKVEQLEYDYLTMSSDAMLDRQGRMRLTLPNSLRTSFPFRYQYLGPKGAGRPRPLAETTGLPGLVISPDNYFGERTIPLGFAEDPNVLYYASNAGRDTYGIYSFDLAGKKRGSLAMENPAYDLIGPPDVGFPGGASLVFDRFSHSLVGVRYENALRTTAWLRPEWRGVQAQLEKLLPGRGVELTDWDEAGRRFVVSTQGPADPGAIYVYDTAAGRLSEFVRRAPWIDTNHTHLTLPFSYATPDGARVSGLVTVPQQPRLKPIPMVVICPDQPWERVRSEFQTDVQALAGMGFVVVQLNGRGAWGLGLKQRQSLTAGYDLVQVDDIAATVVNLEKIFNVNLKRVALMGRGHGGFIALRTLQTYPDRFRCAIALDAPVDLAGWIAEQKWTDNDVLPQLTRGWLGDGARLKAAPLTSHPEALTKPVLMLNYPGPEGTEHRGLYVTARGFAASVNRQGGAVRFEDLPTDYMRGLPAARAAVFDRIEEFLNLHVYDFKVKLDELQVIK